MKTNIRVCDAMTKEPIVLRPDDDLQKCAQKMLEKHVGAMIIKENGKAIGIITEQDIVRKAVAKGINPIKMNVREIMETSMKTISPEQDIFDALVFMRDENIRHLPVVDNGKMVGLLTAKDILKIQPQLFDLLVEKIELREEERKPIYRIKDKEGICQNCGNYAEELTNVGGTLVCKDCEKELK